MENGYRQRIKCHYRNCKKRLSGSWNQRLNLLFREIAEANAQSTQQFDTFCDMTIKGVVFNWLYNTLFLKMLIFTVLSVRFKILSSKASCTIVLVEDFKNLIPDIVFILKYVL